MDSSSANVVLDEFIMACMSFFHAVYLSYGSRMTSRLVSSSQPSTIWTSAGVPSASSFGSDRFSRRGIGSSLPAWGRAVTWTDRGTEWDWAARSSGMSAKTRMMSSIKLSDLPDVDVGIQTDIVRLGAKGISESSSFGSGARGCTGLWSSSGFQSLQRGNSLLRSVTISENEHHVGGFGDPPNVSLSAR